VGTGFGIDALSKNSAVKTDCPDYRCPQGNYQEAQTKIGVAQTSAHVSTVTLSVGAAMVISSAILVWTARDQRRTAAQSASMQVFAAPSPQGGAMGVGGSW
jgi:hypothetical protein